MTGPDPGISIARVARAARAIASAPDVAVTGTSGLDSEAAWAAFLGVELRCDVRVRFTRSRKTPVQVRPLRAPRGALEVRLHGGFGDAPPDLGAAVASWIRSGRRAPRACARLDAYIAELLERLPPSSPRHAVVARGAHHDLERMARELLAGELADEFPARRPRVSWGRRGPSRTRRSLRLGSYDSDSNLVRIHPVLDQPGIPEWFVRYVVFHELLHAVFPPARGNGDRWIHHGRAFRQREARYADYARALEWERAHLGALIRSARRGTPFAPTQSPDQARTQAPAQAPGQTRAPRRTGVLRLLQGLLFPGADQPPA